MTDDNGDENDDEDEEGSEVEEVGETTAGTMGKNTQAGRAGTAMGTRRPRLSSAVYAQTFGLVARASDGCEHVMRAS